MKKSLTISATVVAAMLALAGCSTGTDGGSMPGMDHGSSSAATQSSLTAGEHNSADAMFAQMMIPHHAQAVQMSDIMLTKNGIDPQVTALAQEIKAAQDPEIAKMTTWLDGWGEPTTMSGDHSMNGMMTTADLEKLTAAQGAEASKLFLTQMIAHHEGAVEMAKTEIADGKNADAIALAKSIVASQENEIKTMKDLLTSL
ncbi:MULTISPECIES: DUF305 domain-containing protein [Micrococcaceae]|uniref:DUF305 domain-containing protein n=1 Tax=Micrococcaceae TaxID=1268 RepID=UPI001C4FC1CF|nr:DUF305 domain-containing protein [Arthrobacter sp. BF1]